ncbi:MAG TPA: zf-HC2 domain-containing protein [Pyrinomonadaceae bacterium]|nr:zf-HC2 domain-containing protein [Pyrinomonadaceae bacterium]
MQELNGRPVCHRAEDLVTYLYGEASESDARDFRAHLQQCDACRSEFAAFDQMHESILVWRNEALGASFTPAAVVAEPSGAATQFTRPDRRLSAVAALREFFSVSPLWLRGATAFAGLLLCALLIFAVSRSWQRPDPSANETAEARFTQADLDRAVAEAKMQVAKEQQTAARKPDETVDQAATPRVALVTSRRSNRPRVKALTQQEREQLAADLRLVPGADDEELPFVISDQPDQ